jgi:hypothetical protein
VHLASLADPDLPVGERLIAVLAAQAAERVSDLARPHPFRLDRGDRERAGRRSGRLGPALRSCRETAPVPRLLPCGSHDGRPAMSIATCHTVPMAPVTTAPSLNKYIGHSLSSRSRDQATRSSAYRCP